MAEDTTVLSRFSCGLLPLWKKEDRQTQEWVPDGQTGKHRRQLHTTLEVFAAHTPDPHAPADPDPHVPASPDPDPAEQSRGSQGNTTHGRSRSESHSVHDRTPMWSHHAAKGGDAHGSPRGLRIRK